MEDSPQEYFVNGRYIKSEKYEPDPTVDFIRIDGRYVKIKVRRYLWALSLADRRRQQRYLTQEPRLLIRRSSDKQRLLTDEERRRRYR